VSDRCVTAVTVMIPNFSTYYSSLVLHVLNLVLVVSGILNLASTRVLRYEMKPDETIAAPAATCVTNLSPGFFWCCFVGYLVHPKISKLLF
jgi:hypothetical protein